MIKSKNNIHTGKLLSDFVLKNKVSKSNLSKQIGRGSLSVSNYLLNDTMQTNILLDLCHATRHNFFQDMAQMLPKDFTDSGVTEGLIADKNRIIAQLEEEIKVLKIQNDVLMKVRT